MALLKRFIRETEGADAMEYTLVGSLIAVAILSGASAFAGSLNELFTAAATTIVGAFGG